MYVTCFAEFALDFYFDSVDRKLKPKIKIIFCFGFLPKLLHFLTDSNPSNFNMFTSLQVILYHFMSVNIIPNYSPIFNSAIQPIAFSCNFKLCLFLLYEVAAIPNKTIHHMSSTLHVFMCPNLRAKHAVDFHFDSIDYSKICSLFLLCKV